MGLKEFYHAMEDKYYGVLDWMDAHGLPVYGAVDALEAQNIPSFPVAVLLLLLIIGGIWFAVAGGGSGAGTTLSVLVVNDTQDPLSGVKVQLSGADIAGQTLLTDSTGKVLFTNLPAGKSVTIDATRDGYTITSKSIALDVGDNNERLAAVLIPKTKSISLQLYQSNSTQVYTDSVALQFSCASDSTYAKSQTVTNGHIVLDDVPAGCDTLSVITSDSGVELQSGTVDTTAGQPSLYLNKKSQGSASLEVLVIGDNAQPVAGIDVALNSQYGDALSHKSTDNGGRVQFTGLAADTYTITANDASGTYASKTSDPIQVSNAETTSIVLDHSSVGEVRVQVVDESNLSPVANASVQLSRGTQVVDTRRTDASGKVTFSVSSNLNLSVSVDHPDYLKTSVPVSISSAGFSTISLTRATAQNSQVLTVQIKDELGNPVEGAQVALKKAGTGASVGAAKTTGVSGTIAFTSLEEGSYFVSAYKPGYSDQKRSDVVQVQARTNVSLTVQLSLGTGTIDLQVNDESGSALAGASVQAMDALTNSPIGSEAVSDVEGKVSFTLRADKIVYFIASESSHASVTSVPLPVKKSVNQSLTLSMPKSVSKLETRILGITLKGQPLESDSALVPGQSYTVLMGLYLPEGSTYTEAGVHVLTGKEQGGQTNPTENDDWFIRDVRAPSAIVKRGTTFTPPIGLGIDNQNLTTGNSKWANITVQNPHDGLTLIEVDVQVKDSAVQGGDLPFYYRAFAKSGTYSRFPVDAVLGGSESTGDKQGLYANANLKTYSIGNTSSTCTKDLCLAMVIEDLQSHLQSPVVGDVQVDVSTSHKLGFVFTSLSDQVLQDAKLRITSTTSSADLKGYEVINAVGVKKSGTAQGNAIEVPLGTILRDNVVTGFTNLSASKDGSSRVTLSIIVGKDQLFTRDITVKVNAASVFDVEVLPRAILPLLTNQLLVKAFVSTPDGAGRIGLENATVTIKKNGALLTSGYTDSDGVFPYELNEPNVGEVIEFTIEKAGYKPVVKTIAVGDNVVLFSPNQINETLTINGVVRKTREVRVTNLSNVPLTIKSIRSPTSFGDLVKFELLSDNVLNTEIPVNGDVNVAFALSLTDKGQKLLTAQSFSGALTIETTAAQSDKTFANQLPLTVKAGFGGEVDDATCLSVTPTKWDIFTNTTDKKQLAFTIVNNCVVKGQPIKLTALQARVKQVTGDTLGTFSATGNSRSVDLGADFKTVLDEVPPKTETTVTVQFAPGSILSGVATPELVFQATNLTSGGTPDLVTDSVKLNLVVNDLTKCLEVKTPQSLTIESCPINLGYGQYGNYFNQGLYQPTGIPYYNPSFSVLNQTTNPSGSSLLPSNQSTPFGPTGSPYGNNYSLYNPYYSRGVGVGTNNYYGATGYNGLGAYNPTGAQFNPINGNYAGLQGVYQNPYVDSFNTQPGAYNNYIAGCGTTEIRVDNSCQSEVDVQLDADPNLQTSQNNFSLKPNATQRVRIASGVRIGTYGLAINAKAKGSTDATTQVASLAVLIKSPTEVNGDCISLDRTKYSFNELIQTPVKGKVYNNCYDQGVRLVERGDTVTLASFFSPDAPTEVVKDPYNQTNLLARNNSLVNNIQTTGLSTKDSGTDGGKIQVYEFQIFPDFTTYKRQLAPGQNGAVAEKLLDIKTFAEKNYYRAESYGVISVKYLDAFGAGQVKQFPVIFENLFKLASALDALIGGGNPDVTKFQDCINTNALTGKGIASDKSIAPLAFGDTDFKRGSTFTFTTQYPDSVIKVSDLFCGGQDYLDALSPTKLTSADNAEVFATFAVVDKRDIQVTITRPLTLTRDVVIEGTLDAMLTRTFVNSGTQKVSIPVKITVQKPRNPISNTALQLQACTNEGYFTQKNSKGDSFSKVYGFDQLKWDWTFDNTPDCSTNFCDATQLMLYVGKTKLKKFNDFLNANKDVFSGKSGTLSTRTLLLDVHESFKDLKGYNGNGKETFNFFIAKRNGSNTDALMSIDPKSKDKELIDAQMDKVRAASDLLGQGKTIADKKTYVRTMDTSLDALNTTFGKQWVVVLDKDKLNSSVVCAGSKDGQCVDKLMNLLQVMGANKRDIAGGARTKLYWLYGDYSAFHKAFVNSLVDPANDTVSSIELALGNFDWKPFAKECSTTAATPVKVDCIDPTRIDISYLIGTPIKTADGKDTYQTSGLRVKAGSDLLQAIATGLDGAQVAYSVPTDTTTIEQKERDYVLENAQTITGFTYKPYGADASAASAKAFESEFLDSSVKLLPDTYTGKLVSDIVDVKEPTYDYQNNLSGEKWLGAAGFDAWKNTSFLADKKTAFPQADGKITIPAAGTYTLHLDAQWTSASTKATALGLYVGTNSSDYTGLEAMDTKNGNTAYAKNPFFTMSFDGLTGGKTRTYGVGAGLKPKDDPNSINLNGKVGVGINNTVNTFNVKGYVDASQSSTAQANAIASFTQKQGKPTLFAMQKLGDNWSADFAPNRPAAVRAAIYSPTTPIYQYVIGDAEIPQITGVNPYTSPIVAWLDCSNANQQFFSAENASSGNALACNPARPTDFVLNGQALGTDFTYLGIALLPPGDASLFMYPICADNRVELQNAKGSKASLSVDRPTTSLQKLELASNIPAPETLSKMIALIDSGSACATVDTDKFNIIWNMGSHDVVPSTMTCSAISTGNTLTPQPAPTTPDTTTGGTPTPAPQTPITPPKKK